MWAAQLIDWHRPRTHITSGGAGTMGFAVPAALGVALAHPDETVWVIVGDGGFQMTNQELSTLVQENVRNVKIAIVNNGYLAWSVSGSSCSRIGCTARRRSSVPTSRSSPKRTAYAV